MTSISFNEKELFKVLGYYYDSVSIPVWYFRDGAISNTNFSNSLLNLIDLSSSLIHDYETGDRKYTWKLLQTYPHEFYFFFNTGYNTKVRESIMIGPVLKGKEYDDKKDADEIKDYSFSGQIWSDYNNKVVKLLANSPIRDFIKSICFIMRLFEVEPPSPEAILEEYHKNNNDNTSQRSYSSIINKAIEVISENIQDKISLQLVAGYINISPKYLSYLFTKETGMNFCDYVQYSRIDVAKKKLLESNISYSDLCYNLGFSSQSYFNSVFKKYTGVTPKEFRTKKTG